MKKPHMAALGLLPLLLTGCAVSQEPDIQTAPTADSQAADAEVTVEPVEQEQAEAGNTVIPLPDTTMNNLSDAILAVSFEKGNAYVDDEGILQLDVTVYTYDKYDLVRKRLMQYKTYL